MKDGNKTRALLSALDAYPRRYTTPPSGRSPGFRQNSAQTPLSASLVTKRTHLQRDCLEPSYLFRYFEVRILYHQKITAVGRCH